MGWGLLQRSPPPTTMTTLQEDGPYCPECPCMGYSYLENLCLKCYVLRPIEEEQEFEEDREPCSDCGAEDGYDSMGGLCADCFWEEDARLKRERRANPHWRFSRAYSTGITLLNMSTEQAILLGAKSVADYGLELPEDLQEIVATASNKIDAAATEQSSTLSSDNPLSEV